MKRHFNNSLWVTVILSSIVLCLIAVPTQSQEASPSGISAALLGKIDTSTDRALAWLAKAQEADGRFPTLDMAQPAVTSLCIMAFLAKGHLPGEGPYGDCIKRGIDFVISCQSPDGYFSFLRPEQRIDFINVCYTVNYNYSISGLMLAEAYGMTDPETSQVIKKSLERALEYSIAEQNKPKADPRFKGGWCYRLQWPPGRSGGWYSDLSVTSWNLLFLRSAKNAGFAVPVQVIDEAVEFVKRSYDPVQKTFLYKIGDKDVSRAMSGAGIVALSMSGYHDSPMAKDAAKWILARPLDRYNNVNLRLERYHYSVFYASLGLFLLGDEYFEPFFPRTANTLLNNQRSDGSWPTEVSMDADPDFGNAYTTALVILSLSLPDQILPIFQR